MISLQNWGESKVQSFTKALRKYGEIKHEEMFEIFNMGVGLMLAVNLWKCGAVSNCFGWTSLQIGHASSQQCHHQMKKIAVFASGNGSFQVIAKNFQWGCAFRPSWCLCARSVQTARHSVLSFWTQGVWERKARTTKQLLVLSSWKDYQDWLSLFGGLSMQRKSPSV